MIKLKSPYSMFAKVYDRTMNEIPYHHWAYYIYQLFEAHNLTTGDWVVDIGTGTGIIAGKLSAYYKMVAIDISYSMLSFAKVNNEIKCVQADMKALPFLNDEISSAFSTHDCLNYLTDEKMMYNHFKEIYRILKPNGLYLFDYSTEYNVLKHFNDKVFNEHYNNYHMKWSNTYDLNDQIVTSVIDITEYLPNWYGIFVFWKRKKYREIHIQKVFSENTIEKLCKMAGFKILKKDYDYGENKSNEYANILVYVLQKINL
ncbi:MAG: class I SAM-dependent methyltransferase [Spirochaetia bacterium]|nr:class I SAM-dependent methyltransferase [Spirochaetia bacterium]